MIQTIQNAYIKGISEFLFTTKEFNPTIDISSLNILEASRTALILSTEFFTKFPERTIRWEVKDEETKRNISVLKLKNMELCIKN